MYCNAVSSLRIQTRILDTLDHSGRQSESRVDSDGDTTVEITTEYTYEDSGIRIRQTTVKIEADSDDEVPSSKTTTEYVISHGNHTGYAQTIEEWVDGTQTRSFTIGHDVIAEASTAITQAYQAFLYDGHGSVRQLTDEVANVIKAAYETIAEVNEVSKLDYDAYGEAINFAASTAVSVLLYSGEYLDTVTQQQYLRARFYDSSTGRFNRVDPFEGFVNMPATLHKYAYASFDPISMNDPNGLSAVWIPGLGGVLGAITQVLASITLAQLAVFAIGVVAVGAAACGIVYGVTYLTNSGSGGICHAQRRPDPHAMRVQLQENAGKGTGQGNTASVPIASRSSITTRQVRDALGILYGRAQLESWFPSRYNQGLWSSVINLSIRLKEFPLKGGVLAGGNILRAQFPKPLFVYRVDVDNLRGHNLRQ